MNNERALAGLRVLELGGIGPVPFAGLVLADMGADVVRIDRPGIGPSPLGLDPLTRGKRSIIIDFDSNEGRDLGRSLASRADIVLEGFRPGVAERLGLGPDDCQADNPALVYGRMTGWGQTGPLASVAGHDINYVGLTGALHAMGREGEPPAIPLFLVGDLGGGAMFLVAGVLAATLQAKLTGVGDVVDAAIVDGVARLMTYVYAALPMGEWSDRRGTNLLDTGRPWYDVYETSDGGWMCVGAIEVKFYDELIRVLEIPAAEADRDDPESWPILRKLFEARFASRTRDEWTRIFATVDACVTPVLSLAEAPAHPHLAARGTFELDAGASIPAGAPRFSNSEAIRVGSPPVRGSHTREVLQAWKIDVDIDDLINRNVVGVSSSPAR
jgi:alpha-methylacyl-CoA racemase